MPLNPLIFVLLGTILCGVMYVMLNPRSASGQLLRIVMFAMTVYGVVILYHASYGN